MPLGRNIEDTFPTLIWRAPAAGFTDFAQWWLTPDAYRLFIEPHIADMYLEHYRHLKNDDEKAAERAVTRCYIRIAWPFACAFIKALWGLLVRAGG